MKNYYQSNSSHFQIPLIDELSPQARADIQKYLIQKQNDGIWEFVKYILIAILIIIIILIILYYVYRKCQNNSSDNNLFQQQQYGQYSHTQPVFAGKKQSYQDYEASYYIPTRNKQIDYDQSVTWRLQTTGKGR